LNAQHTYNRTGPTTVSLVTMTPSGCVDTIRQTILVVIRTPARFNFFVDSCNAKVFYTNKSPLAVNYSWDFGDNEFSTETNPVHSYHMQGEYSTTFTVNAGTVCPESTTVQVNSPADGLYTLYIPNSFTPNGDGNNELFIMSAVIPCDTYSLSIFNRWGQEVFRTDDPLGVGWDGKYKGEPAAEGVYVFKLTGTYSQKTGYILLKR